MLGEDFLQFLEETLIEIIIPSLVMHTGLDNQELYYPSHSAFSTMQELI